MVKPDEDIFGQIDALLGKRSPAVLTEKNIQGDDFPTLTEVINTEVLDSQSNVLADSLITGDNAARQVERRVFERRQNSSSDARMILAGGINSPVSEDLESKLMEMFRDQHKNLEKSLRLIIQEELRRNKSYFL
jgi:hypothetical protein